MLLTADANWEPVSSADGVSLARQVVPNNPYFNYRATTDTDVTVDALCEGTYDWGSVSKDHEELKSRQVLEDHGDTRVVYDQVKTPPTVPPRDFAFTVKRIKKSDGSCKVEFFTSNEKAPPLQKGWVRLSAVKGYWLFEPTATGTHLTYELFSDPGGHLPAMLVHGPQQGAVVKSVQKGITFSRARVTGARR
ncbi:MAG: hypothetical protein IPJ65_33765 [Archangiaceae bacterium]|nr:hypothetical protein [Archangiaceae bacterium]